MNRLVTFRKTAHVTLPDAVTQFDNFPRRANGALCAALFSVLQRLFVPEIKTVTTLVAEVVIVSGNRAARGAFNFFL